ncbi:MAG: carbohydrate binding domain-containing protein [Thermoplasmatota archaeon]
MLTIIPVLPVAKANALNYVNNPGFETGSLAGWSTSQGSTTFAADPSHAHSGSSSGEGIATDSGDLGRLYQDVSPLMVPGHNYEISGWIKTQGVSGGGPPCGAVIALDYVSSGGGTPGDGYIKEIGYASGTQGWTYYDSGSFTLPPWPSDAISAWFLFDFNCATGTAWWDDVCLTQAGDACVAVPPTPPQNPSAAPGLNKITLSWSAPASSGTAPVSSYRVYRGLASGQEGATPIASPSSASYVDSGLPDGSTRYYWITAVSADGESLPSKEVSSTTEIPLTVAARADTEQGAPTGSGGLAVSKTTFTSTISGGVGPYNKVWCYGDGVCDITGSHTYQAAGTYDAELIVGDSMATGKTIHIPVAVNGELGVSDHVTINHLNGPTVRCTQTQSGTTNPLDPPIFLFLRNCIASIQQNFFVNDPSGGHYYWAQNVILIWYDEYGQEWAAPQWEVWDAQKGGIIACNGVGGSAGGVNMCPGLSGTPVAVGAGVPITAALSSNIQSGSLVFQSSIMGTPSNFGQWPSFALGSRSYIVWEPAVCQGPATTSQLSVTAPIGGPAGGVTTASFSNPTDGSDSTQIEGLDGQWAAPTVEGRIDEGCTYTGEHAQDIQWTPQPGGQGSFGYVTSQTVPGDMGLGYEVNGARGSQAGTASTHGGAATVAFRASAISYGLVEADLSGSSAPDDATFGASASNLLTHPDTLAAASLNNPIYLTTQTSGPSDGSVRLCVADPYTMAGVIEAWNGAGWISLPTTQVGNTLCASVATAETSAAGGLPLAVSFG